MSVITECKYCGAVIDTEYGKDAPAEHSDAAGTTTDPRSPGDRDDVCDVCCYIAPNHAPPPQSA